MDPAPASHPFYEPPRRPFAWVTWTLVATTVGVFVLQLIELHKYEQARAQLDRLIREDPEHRRYFQNLQATVAVGLGEHARAVELYRQLLQDAPEDADLHLSMAHALKTQGSRDRAIASYRQAAGCRRGFGDAYWSLANLKTYRFDESEIAAMRSQLARTDIGDEDRLHFHFALGKALEDLGDYAESFRHYAEGNRIRRGQMDYSPEETTERSSRSAAVFPREFLELRAGWGCCAPDPIFIVGLPRSGSTLIEQILSSHSAVEGTMELPDIGAIARALGGRRRRRDETAYPELLGDLSAERLRELGEEYLSRTRIQRKTDRPFFIDKTPQNFLHLGLIRLTLPNAKIIDARRHPMAACFSVFKQHFARGQPFAYDLDDLGCYYRDYVAMMAHFDRVSPGKVHRVLHEAMVGDTETEIRRLLDYCGLPFEDGCLRFHETDRAVRTASSEQVRRPIFRDGLDQWRHYETWLGPLKTGLGDVIENYPEAPSFESV